MGAAGTPGPRPGPWATGSSLQSLRAGYKLDTGREGPNSKARSGISASEPDL